MDVKQMNYIVKIAEEGGITKAAKRLFITQSALDQQLIKLENELGVQLFYRSRTNLSLTPAGQVYVDYAKRIIGLKNEAYNIIHDISDRQKGTLTLAFAPERGMEMFTSVYPLFYDMYPGISVVPREIGVKKQLEMLQNGELDLGFVSMQESEIPRLVFITLIREEFVLITPLNHPLAKRAAPEGEPLAKVAVGELEGLRFSLMYRESTQRAVIDPLFENSGFKPDLFLETASNRANVSMVRKGLSCSIVPYYYARKNRDVACFLIEGNPCWNMSVCYRRNEYLNKAANDFIELAGRYFRGEQGTQREMGRTK